MTYEQLRNGASAASFSASCTAPMIAPVVTLAELTMSTAPSLVESVGAVFESKLRHRIRFAGLDDVADSGGLVMADDPHAGQLTRAIDAEQQFDRTCVASRGSAIDAIERCPGRGTDQRRDFERADFPHSRIAGRFRY